MSIYVSFGKYPAARVTTARRKCSNYPVFDPGVQATDRRIPLISIGQTLIPISSIMSVLFDGTIHIRPSQETEE